MADQRATTEAGDAGFADVETLGFEQAQAELEAIVQRLEDPRTGLDQALVLWERGEALHAWCQARLDNAQARIEKLQLSPEEQAAAMAAAAGPSDFAHAPAGGGAADAPVPVVDDSPDEPIPTTSSARSTAASRASASTRAASTAAALDAAAASPAATARADAADTGAASAADADAPAADVVSETPSEVDGDATAEAPSEADAATARGGLF